MLALVSVVFYSVLVALLFSLAVFIHEFGHFIAARLLGLRADVFSIGFGPALWKKQIGRTVYKICAIPFGGYVSLPQLDPSGMKTIQGGTDSGDADQQLEEVAPWKKIVVAFAGPFGNVVLATVIAFAIYFAPSGSIGGAGTVVGGVLPDSGAYNSGLRSGDKIESVNGVNVESWSELQIESMLSGDRDEAEVCVLDAAGVSKRLSIPLSTNNLFGVKMISGIYPCATCVVSNVFDGGVAQNAGIEVGDRIIGANGNRVLGLAHFTSVVAENGEKQMSLELERAGKKLTVSLSPRLDSESGKYLIGVLLQNEHLAVQSWMRHRNPWRQLKGDAQSVFRVLQALIAPRQTGERKAVAEQIGGPVTIISGLYRSMRSSFWDAWGFLRMICINLAILNLFPLPVLDGGHIVFSIYEIVARRKAHPRLVSALTNTFAILLIGLMLLLVYRDVILQSKLAKAFRERQQRSERVVAPSADSSSDKR